MTDKGFTLDMTIPGMREAVAFAVLESRLKMAIHFKRTDSYALQASRGWAEKVGYPNPNFRTMKQALAFVEDVNKQIQEANSATPAAE